MVCSSVFCMSPLQLVDVRPHAVAGSLVRLVDGVHYRRLKEAILGLLLRTNAGSVYGGAQTACSPQLTQISSRSRTAKFRFKATGDSTGFRCALVLLPTRKHAKTPSPKYVACGSSKTFKHLKIGKYVLYVRAVGPGGTRSPIVYRFKIV